MTTAPGARLDLHTHSTCSDGTVAPADLVAEAVAAGLSMIALTDHDTTAGWAEATRAAGSAPLRLVRGVEISCETPGGISLHLLGLLIDPAHAPLAAELDRARDDRVPRAQEMVRRMVADGLPISWELVMAQVAPGATVGRPHLADALIAAGVVPDRDEAFRDLLSGSGRYFVGHYAVDPELAVRLVRAAGGVPVFAHPGAVKRGPTVDDATTAALAGAGLAALEVDHPDHDPATRARLRGLAADLGLEVTGSSDYHGTGKVNRLGQDTTDPEVWDRLAAQAGPATPVVGGLG